MIEKPKNGVSHPKKDLLKKINPPKISKKYIFFFKLNKYNDRKTQKCGKPPQKRLIKKITLPKNFKIKYFFSSN